MSDALNRIREIHTRSKNHESLSGVFALDDIAALMDGLEAATTALAEAVVIIAKWSPGGMDDLAAFLSAKS